METPSSKNPLGVNPTGVSMIESDGNSSSSAPIELPCFPGLASFDFVPARYRPGNLGTWSGHLPFARDLIESLQPRVLVELGTHYGESYFGFCQSVRESRSPTICYAVDTWLGDPHAGEYGSEVFEEVERYNLKHYASFSYLLRTTFDDAISRFSDESIDLLHIDGLHTYDAVSHDWQNWFPKVSSCGIVLLHDVVPRHVDFGVWKFWSGISSKYTSYEFHHYHGLGVILKSGPPQRRRAGGILEYLFVPGNAESIRRYYVLCSQRLDAVHDLPGVEVPSTGLDSSQVTVDPGDDVMEILTSSAQQDALGFIPLAITSSDAAKNDWFLVEGQPNTWRGITRDPWIVIPLELSAKDIRFFVLTMACSLEAPRPRAQLFWTRKDHPRFEERLSIEIPLIADGNQHTYVVDLHGGAHAGDLNYNWHHGIVTAVRLDPLNGPGVFTIFSAGFVHQDRAEAGSVREALHLLPLRTELSYRYLLGSGIEIGALQNPLSLRPDTHVRYADRLNLAQARAHYPELKDHLLVDPIVICEADKLSPIADGSIDFVIANHVLEHMRDPLGAIREWLRVVRPGGHIYVAIPEHTNPLDRLRSVTPFDHLIADFEKRANRKKFDREHYREWIASTRADLSAAERTKAELQLISKGYAIHFHTFTAEIYSRLLQEAARRFSAEVIAFHRDADLEVPEDIGVLRKV
jgi:SAM-dependent methyltransferase